MRPAPVLFAAAVLAAATVLVKSRSNGRGKEPPDRGSVLPVAIVQHSIPKHSASEAQPEKPDGPRKSCPDQRSGGEVEKVLAVGQKGGSKVVEEDDGAEGSERRAVVGPDSAAEKKKTGPYKEVERDRAKNLNGPAPPTRENSSNRAVVEQEEAQEEEEEGPWAGEG